MREIERDGERWREMERMSFIAGEWGIERVEYGVATISRLLKIIGLFCKRAL